MHLGIKDGRILAWQEPVSSSLDLLGDSVEGSAAVMRHQVGYVFEKQELRAIIAEFPY